MQCPRDRSELELTTPEPDTSACPKCKGIFIRNERFARIIKHNGVDIAKLKKAEMPMPDCPGCHSGLRLYKVESIDVDLCEACMGVWLDKGELDQVKSYLDKARSLREQDSPVVRDQALGIGDSMWREGG